MTSASPASRTPWPPSGTATGPPHARPLALQGHHWQVRPLARPSTRSACARTYEGQRSPSRRCPPRGTPAAPHPAPPEEDFVGVLGVVMADHPDPKPLVSRRRTRHLRRFLGTQMLTCQCVRGMRRTDLLDPSTPTFSRNPQTPRRRSSTGQPTVARPRAGVARWQRRCARPTR